MKIKVEMLQDYLRENNLASLELAREIGISLAEVKRLLGGESVGMETARRFIRYFGACEAQRMIDWKAIGKKNPLADDDESDKTEGENE